MPLRNSSLEINRSHPTITYTDNLRVPATMVFPDPYPGPPETYAFSPSPDAPKEDDSIAQWDQLVGYARPERDTGSNWLQQIGPENPEIAEDPEGLHAIPESLTTWQRLLLQTTQADLERRAVSVIKCRLCPIQKFKTWAYFSRHCRDCEEHPAEIKCCERCGIYFGRQDSKKRHNDSATRACCETTPDEAAWKKHQAKRLLAAFQARVTHCLKTGEELGPTFAAIARVELPDKSKKAFSSRKNKLEGNRSQVAGRRTL